MGDSQSAPGSHVHFSVRSCVIAFVAREDPPMDGSAGLQPGLRVGNVKSRMRISAPSLVAAPPCLAGFVPKFRPLTQP